MGVTHADKAMDKIEIKLNRTCCANAFVVGGEHYRIDSVYMWILRIRNVGYIIKLNKC